MPRQKVFFPKLAPSQDKLITLNDYKIVPLLNQKSYLKAYQLRLQIMKDKTSRENSQDLSEKIIINQIDDLSVGSCSKQITQNSTSLYRMTPQKYYHEAIFSYNIGFAAWKLNLKAQGIQALENCLKSYQLLINSCESDEQKIVYCNEMIKISLQLCVAFSQINQHQNAYKVALQTLQKLIQLFNNLQKLTSQLQKDLQNIHCRKRHKQVDFKFIVIKQAHQKLGELLGFSKCIENLITTCNKNANNKKIQQTIQNLYLWKENFENNEKFIRISLNLPVEEEDNSSERNILGINKIPQWIQSFSIGELMMMSPKRIEDYLNFDPYYLLSGLKILELATYFSVGCFTLATEIRFKKNQDIVKIVNKSMKYLKMNEDPEFLKCKALHLKSIELAGVFIPSAKYYLKHLISSFNKNYKTYMDKIDEEESSKFFSQIQSYNFGPGNYTSHNISKKKNSSSTNYPKTRSQSKKKIHLSRKRSVSQKSRNKDKTNLSQKSESRKKNQRKQSNIVKKNSQNRPKSQKKLRKGASSNKIKNIICYSMKNL